MENERDSSNKNNLKIKNQTLFSETFDQEKFSLRESTSEGKKFN